MTKNRANQVVVIYFGIPVAIPATGETPEKSGHSYTTFVLKDSFWNS
jgi:hypothetical protein